MNIDIKKSLRSLKEVRYCKLLNETLDAQKASNEVEKICLVQSTKVSLFQKILKKANKIRLKNNCLK